MKKLLLALAALFVIGFPISALAANCSTYPFTLTNGQTADANQVMSNFNTILSCANLNLAHNGANSDITSINGLTTPLSTAEGGTGNTTGAATTATAWATGRTITLTGDATGVSAAFDGTANLSFATSITGLANSKLATMADQTFKGNVSGGSATPVDLTVTQMTTALSGQTATTLANGADARFAALPQNSQSAAYGLILTDGGKEIYHPSADTTARIWTIPANASVAFPVATKVEIVNDCSAGVLTLAITSDTLEWFPAGTTGSRTLAACGMATLTKITTTKWAITGAGLN